MSSYHFFKISRCITNAMHRSSTCPHSLAFCPGQFGRATILWPFWRKPGWRLLTSNIPDNVSNRGTRTTESSANQPLARLLSLCTRLTAGRRAGLGNLYKGMSWPSCRRSPVRTLPCNANACGGKVGFELVTDGIQFYHDVFANFKLAMIN